MATDWKAAARPARGREGRMQTLKKLGMGPKPAAIPSELSMAKAAARGNVERARSERPKYDPQLMDAPTPDIKKR